MASFFQAGDSGFVPKVIVADENVAASGTKNTCKKSRQLARLRYEK
jgi:hypothetical protein